MDAIVTTNTNMKRRPAKNLYITLCKHKYVYLMALPVIAYYIIFQYLPMFGVSIAFFDYRITKPLFDCEWVGLKNFINFFNGQFAWRTIRNTFSISLIGLVFSFPIPIILAILLNEVKKDKFKNFVQTVTFMPHFISVVVMCGIVLQFVSYDGFVNELLSIFGVERVSFMTTQGWFYPIFTAMGIWQNMGWDSIIYLSALSSIDQSLYESAAIDGAGRFKQIFSITLPGLMPTIIVMFILSTGFIMNVSLEKVLLLYNPSIYSVADVISTHVYRRGIIEASYSYAAAVGLFNSLVNCTLLLLTNKLSKKFTETGLF